MSSKIAILNKALEDLGYSQRLVWNEEKKGGQDGYNELDARDKRTANLEGLIDADYPKACLFTVASCTSN
jgi:hypothetical protein